MQEGTTDAKRIGAHRPIVGMVPTYKPREGELRLKIEYLDSITNAGGAPLVLPIGHDAKTYEALFPFIDGFVLTGGQDISPEIYGGEQYEYGEQSDFTPEREALECLILDYAYRFDIPVLGICRGMQMMNVFFGGTLYQDLSEQFKSGAPIDGTHWQRKDYALPSHFVSIVQESKLGEIMKAETLATNSMHHQGVNDVAPLLRPVAFGSDGLVEAVKVEGRTFMVGVQWHPEYFSGEKCMGCLFTSLVAESQKAAARRPADFHIDAPMTNAPYMTYADGI